MLTFCLCIGLGLCPGEYRTLKRDCIRVVSKAGTWNEAHTACLSEGAHLASIHSISEMQFVKSLMWGARVGKVLLGRIVAAVFISCTYVQNCNTRFHLYNVQGESITSFACLILSEHVLSTKAELQNVSFDKKTLLLIESDYHVNCNEPIPIGKNLHICHQY